MIRVALVHRDLHQVTRGGICTVYRSLAAHLTEQGASVTLITQESPHPVRMPGVTVVSLPRTENLSDHRDAVAEALHDVAPDVVDCSTWEAETLHYLALPREHHAPVLVRGEFSAARLGASSLARDERQLVHAAERVIAVSEFAARDLAQEYGISLPPAVPNGVDRTRFHPGEPSMPRSGYRIDLDTSGDACGAGMAGTVGQISSRTSIPALLSSGETLAPWSLANDERSRIVWVGKITPMKGWDILEAAALRLRDIATVTVLLGHSPALARGQAPHGPAGPRRR